MRVCFHLVARFEQGVRAAAQSASLIGVDNIAVTAHRGVA